MRTVINGIDINEEGELLLVRKKETLILPWGKIELDEADNERETELEALHREIGEELNKAEILEWSILPYKSFQGTTPHSQKQIQANTYFIKFPEWTKITPSAEISEAKYMKITKDVYNLCSDITKDIIDTLAQDWLLQIH